MTTFTKATRKNAKLRLALSGTSGTGKTYSALLMAKVFGSKIAVLDSERGSASLYADLVPFDVCELEGKSPLDYVEAIQAAAKEGYEVLIVDSYTHSWLGAIELVDKLGGWVKGGKVVSPAVQKLVDTILSYPGHVIATMRSKAEHAVEVVDGKARMKKLGMATVARDGTDYEFSVMLELTTDGGLTVSKTRCSAISDGIYTRDDVVKIAQKLKNWLDSGAQVSPADALKEKIKFAATAADLEALIPEIKALPSAEIQALRDIYTARKTALMEQP